MRFNIPNMLTLFRIAVIPVVVALFLTQDKWALWTALGLYPETPGVGTPEMVARNKQSHTGRFLRSLLQ